ncbi:MAG: ATP-binding protein [Rhodospirillales bacterium]|nr:ATP-binding protein [Rhodospirillales bacterium]
MRYLAELPWAPDAILANALREATWRYDKKLVRRLRYARLRHQAAIEDVDYRSPRGLDRALFQKLATGQWIEAHDNLVITGPTDLAS